MRRFSATMFVLVMLAGCTAIGRAASDDIEAVTRKYSGYTVEQAEREGYKLDPFCLDSTSFGLPAEVGAMGFHATDEARLGGPIEAARPQAIMFDREGKVLGVEYEVVTEAVREAPMLFGRTFTRLAPHPGVHDEHYALHLWFGDNPSGQFADFNPKIACPPGSNPQPMPQHGGTAIFFT